MRQKAWRDRASQNDGFYQNGIKAGRIEGLLEGRLEGQRDVAKRMKSRGRPIDEIAEDTGLDAETIRKL
jgi:predicted transposase/invertase (TIGR01784 family)